LLTEIIKNSQKEFGLLAADQGLEPQLTAPEAVVLPLDESAIYCLTKIPKKRPFGNVFLEKTCFLLQLCYNIIGST
jgi:hypothetical protein